jgi:hypothetical protein
MIELLVGDGSSDAVVTDLSQGLIWPESGSAEFTAMTPNTVIVSEGISGSNHPLAHLSGKYNEEPLWDEFLAAINEYRQEVNALNEEE